MRNTPYILCYCHNLYCLNGKWIHYTRYVYVYVVVVYRLFEWLEGTRHSLLQTSAAELFIFFVAHSPRYNMKEQQENDERWTVGMLPAYTVLLFINLSADEAMTDDLHIVMCAHNKCKL